VQANPTAKTIDEYIAGFPNGVQEVLQKIRATIREAAPQAKEAIKYRMLTFTLKGNLVHFAAFKRHIGFYPTPSGIDAFKKELSAYKGAKGSVQFPLEQPIPYDLLRRIVEYRLEEDKRKKWRLARDYELLESRTENLVYIAMIRLMLILDAV